MHKNFSRIILFITLLITITFGISYIWLIHDLPSIEKLVERLTSPSVRVIDRKGKLLYEILPSESGRHTTISLSKIPIVCQQATIATEDRYFYQNPGIDISGIIRAFWINLLHGGEVHAGGSTITQQVVRTLLFDTDERYEVSLRRKLREALLAWKLTHQYSKDEILALYLNHTYYGGMAYGIQAAAQTFFGKAAQDLDTAECALIAGLPQGPAVYNPFTDTEKAIQRQHIVLNLMEEQGYLKTKEHDLAINEPLTFTSSPYPIEAPHFVMMVRNQIDTLFSSEDIYAQGGLIVQTTLDLDWQHLAEHAVSTQIRKVKEERDGMGHNLNSAALVAIDPQTGEVMTLVGSPDYFGTQNGGAINMATTPRQPGSSIKPLVYAAAFDPNNYQTWSPATLILDTYATFQTSKGEPYTPKNYDGLEHGPVLARQALASSLNIPAVKTLNHIGLPALFELAQKMGITTLTNPSQYDLSLALGGGEVKLLELTAAYGAFANGGWHVKPYLIEKITDPEGNLLYQNENSSQYRVIDKRVAWLISDILSDNEARMLGFGENSALCIDRPAAVKTGTTTNWHDNWTIGYTPELVVGVWTGNTNYEAMHNITGLTGAAPIWHQFLREALKDTPESKFQRPDGLVRVEVCALSGLLPDDDCLYTRNEWFIPGTQPTQKDNIYQRIVINTNTHHLADEFTPKKYRSEIIVLDLPPDARNWAHKKGISLLSDFTISTQLASGPSISISSPTTNSIYRITTNLPIENQRIPIRAVSSFSINELTLWLDGQALATLMEAPYEIWWTLATGKHEVWATAKTQNGQKISSTKVLFEVMQNP